MIAVQYGEMIAFGGGIVRWIVQRSKGVRVRVTFSYNSG